MINQIRDIALYEKIKMELVNNKSIVTIKLFRLLVARLQPSLHAFLG